MFDLVQDSKQRTFSFVIQGKGFSSYIVDDMGNMVPVHDVRRVRALFNPAFWDYVL